MIGFTAQTIWAGGTVSQKTNQPSSQKKKLTKSEENWENIKKKIAAAKKTNKQKGISGKTNGTGAAPILVDSDKKGRFDGAHYVPSEKELLEAHAKIVKKDASPDGWKKSAQHLQFDAAEIAEISEKGTRTTEKQKLDARRQQERRLLSPPRLDDRDPHSRLATQSMNPNVNHAGANEKADRD